MTPTGSVLELWRYPVKSMGGERVAALEVDERGAGGDRTHAVHFTSKSGVRALTAREAPGLLRWAASYPDAPEVAPSDPPLATVVSPDGRAFEWPQPTLPAALEADLGRPVTLTRDLAGQQDLGRTLLLTTEATHRALERELGATVDLRRFRTNLHVALDAPAWAELGWEGTRVELGGGVRLRLLLPCRRCVIPTRGVLGDPGPARWPQLLRHLVAEHGTCFGINARVEAAGRIDAGATLAVTVP